MPHRLLVPLALLLVVSAPLAAAQATLATFEEPQQGTDKVFPFTVTPEEADSRRVIVFRNAPTQGFGLVIYNEAGEEAYQRNGTLGLQTLPPMKEGDYRFFIRGTGEFQVTDKILDRRAEGLEYRLNVTETLGGSADAYVMSPSENWTVALEGDVEVEWFDMTRGRETLTPPASRNASWGGAYVITVQGAPGTPYAITFLPRHVETTGAADGAAATPAPGVAFALLAAAAGVALRRRR